MSCQHKWSKVFGFIAYSYKMQGLYCLPRVHFPVENRTGGRAKKLISKPYHNWKYATNDLRKHALCEYHNTSAVLMDNVVLTAEDATARIDLTLDNKAKQQVDQNRKVRHSIIRRSIE